MQTSLSVSARFGKIEVKEGKNLHVLHISWPQVRRGGEDLESKCDPDHEMHLLLFSLFLLFYVFLASMGNKLEMHILCSISFSLQLFRCIFLFVLKFAFFFFCCQCKYMRWLWFGQEITFLTPLSDPQSTKNYKS